MPVTIEEATQLRSKYQHFRVLIIGRANAGKTTILQAVCGAREAPRVYDGQGRRIRAKKSILSPTSFRGIHDIEYELRFRSSPGFIFHDSRGFEAGDTAELVKVRAFIYSRAAERSVNKQLHAIWFCLPTDHDARMITAAELDFFDRCDTGKVPVIAVFTKFDSLDGKAYQELRCEGFKHSEAQQRAPRRADEHFERDHLGRILGQRYPPKKELRVRNMHEVARHEEVVKRTVSELLRKTSDALDTDALRLLLATVQNNNIELCAENLINSGTITAAAQETLESGVFLPGEKLFQFLWDVGAAFPYLQYRNKELLDDEFPLWRQAGVVFFDTLGTLGLVRNFEVLMSTRAFLWLRNILIEYRDGSLTQFVDKSTIWTATQWPSPNEELSLHLQVLCMGAGLAICCGALCWDKSRQIGLEDFQKMHEHYVESGTGARVSAAIKEGFDDIGPYDTMGQRAKLLQIILDNKVTDAGLPALQ